MEMTEREIFILTRTPSVDKAEFVERLWKQFPVGNPEETYIVVGCTVGRKKTFEGNLVTFDLIVEKYRQYHQGRKREDTPDKYIRRIKTFVSEGGYNEVFDLPDQRFNELYKKENK